jgi:hypothetical protein
MDQGQTDDSDIVAKVLLHRKLRPTNNDDFGRKLPPIMAFEGWLPRRSYNGLTDTDE